MEKGSLTVRGRLLIPCDLVTSPSWKELDFGLSFGVLA